MQNDSSIPIASHVSLMTILTIIKESLMKSQWKIGFFSFLLCFIRDIEKNEIFVIFTKKKTSRKNGGGSGCKKKYVTFSKSFSHEDSEKKISKILKYPENQIISRLLMSLKLMPQISFINYQKILHFHQRVY